MSTIVNGSLWTGTVNDLAPDIANATQGDLTPYEYRIAPANAGAATVHAAITLPAEGTTVVTTAITNPDFPRVLSITGGALLMAGDVVIAGLDASGASVSDTIALDGTTKVAGVKAFKTVTSITVPARTTIGDTVTIGVENIFGILHAVYNALRLVATQTLFDGSLDTGGTLAVNAALSQNLYTIAGTPNGAKILSIVYMV